jgi:hypothetical protein
VKPANFFDLVYDPVKKKGFKSQAAFIAGLFSAAGNAFFVGEVDAYRDYANKVFSGRKPLSSSMKDFPNGVNKDAVASYFSEGISENSFNLYKKNFHFPDGIDLDKKLFCKSLARQFELFIDSTDKNSEAENVVLETYEDLSKTLLRETFFSTKKNQLVSGNNDLSPLRYNVVLYDDDLIKLRALEQELVKLDKQETKYSIYTYQATYSSLMLDQSEFEHADVYVLDISRNSNPSSVTSPYHDSTGLEMLEQLKTKSFDKDNKPLFKDSRVYIYTSIQTKKINNVFDFTGVIELSKETTSVEALAIIIKDYLDSCYVKDIFSSARFWEDYVKMEH